MNNIQLMFHMHLNVYMYLRFTGKNEYLVYFVHLRILRIAEQLYRFLLNESGDLYQE